MSLQLILESDICYSLLSQCPLLRIPSLLSICKTAYRRICGLFSEIEFTQILWREEKLILIDRKNQLPRIFGISDFRIFDYGAERLQITKSLCDMCKTLLCIDPVIILLSSSSSKMFSILHDKAKNSFTMRLCKSCRFLCYNT